MTNNEKFWTKIRKFRKRNRNIFLNINLTLFSLKIEHNLLNLYSLYYLLKYLFEYIDIIV